MNLVIVDDEPLARLRLRQLCGDLSDQLPNTVVADFDSGAALLKGLMNPTLRADALLLDVNMPGLDGLALAAYLRQHAPQLAVILVTAAAEHALQAFEVDVTDFVLKPVRSERLLKALQKAAGAGQPPAPAHDAPLTLSVRSGAQELELPLNLVCYFWTDGRATGVKTAQRDYTCRHSLSELEQWLSQRGANGFCRIHRNTLLALSAVEPLGHRELAHNHQVKIKATGEYLTVSRRMWSQLKLQMGASV